MPASCAAIGCSISGIAAISSQWQWGGYSRETDRHHLTCQTVCRLDQLKWPSSVLPTILPACHSASLPVCLAKYAPLAPHPFSRCRNALLLTPSTLCLVSLSLPVVSCNKARARSVACCAHPNALAVAITASSRASRGTRSSVAGANVAAPIANWLWIVNVLWLPKWRCVANRPWRHWRWVMLPLLSSHIARRNCCRDRIRIVPLPAAVRARAAQATRWQRIRCARAKL